MLQEIITTVRDTRNKNLLKPKDTIKLWIDTDHDAFYEAVQDILRRQVNAEHVGYISRDGMHAVSAPIQGSISLVVKTDKLYIIAAEATIDISVQREQMEKDLKYLTGFIASVDKKLDNEKFVKNAKPEVIENERKKRADAVAKMKTLEESLHIL